MNDVEAIECVGSLQRQDVLAKFGEFALKSDNLDKILAEACRLVSEALNTDLAKVMELEEGGETLLVRAGIGWDLGIVGTVRVSASDQSSEGHALRTGKPLVSPDITKETRFEYPDFLIEHGVRALANVPIIGAEGQPPFGILQVDSREARMFSADDLNFLSVYGNMLAAAVDRLQMINNLRTQKASLSASLDRQQNALQTGLIAFFEWDVPNGLIVADKHFVAFRGLDPMKAAAGVTLDDLMLRVHHEDRDRVQAGLHQALASSADYEREFRLVLNGGEIRWLQVRGHCYERKDGQPLRYTGVAIDITAAKTAEAALRQANERLETDVVERTRLLVDANLKLRAEADERRQAEEQLRQSQKMEALGQLTGGIAHDFNNLLVGISGCLELMRSSLARRQTTNLDRYLDTALASANSAAALTHRLLAFSRQQKLDPQRTDVNWLVSGMEEMLRRTVGLGIRIRTSLASNLWSTLYDRHQLESALLNLAINARDAMPTGGQLVIETANVVLPEWRAGGRTNTFPRDGAPGEFVALSVADTGTGMTTDVITHAFEPFFTTKPLGQGTGLGLSMIYGFMKQSGGHIRLESAPGQGTTVTVYLPRHFETSDEYGKAESATRARLVLAKTGPVVLVVDDQPAVRMVVTDVLSGCGYAVLEAYDGSSALQVVASGARLDLLLTDIGLPGSMDGRHLANVVQAKHPGLKVLFMTGHIEAQDQVTATNSLLLEPGLEVLAKPFGIEALASKVQSIIGV
ncbi:ATP-binding protein [Novosphingopyxis sp.]|uniref:ATP-binding protein n=1 Tax=Novosphingopyxis sp. TaxID=2709690 RepID=UPI003B5A6A8D